jgi:PP-loop superfamily ATP-utilizing enzyme
MRNIACFSGGKDSTAMIYAMRERGEAIDGLLVTPTGNELPDVWLHWDRVAKDVEAPTITPKGPSLEQLIRQWNALPNGKMRWCTRAIKIQPVVAWCKSNPDVTLLVGLRADEEDRKGIISTSVDERYPLQEYGMGLSHVRGLLARLGIDVPDRSDCAWCYDQRLGEWYELWLNHPEIYAKAEAWELATGHTFRSKTRDSWPASLRELRLLFESGRKPQRSLKVLLGERQMARQLLIDVGDEEPTSKCRLCSL